MHLARIEAQGINQPRAHRHSIKSAGRSVLAAAALASVLVPVIGCGNTYRPVVSAINPVGPAAQPQKFAVAVASSPNAGTPGLVTIVDFSGDTVLVTANVGVGPYYLNLDTSGATGYTLNSDTTVTSFDISTSLQTRDVLQTTLLAGAAPNSIFSQGGYTYISQPGRNSVAELRGSPLSLQQEFGVNKPTYVVGSTSTTRAYALGSTNAGIGTATAIEITSNTTSSTLNVGRNPVYGVMTADGKRAFIMNKDDGTVSVINAQTNLLDTPNATLTVGTNPVWADLVPTKAELVVANSGNGTERGSLSIINIPLCSAAALPTNPNCNATNPVDAVGFGDTLATVPVGVNPVMVAVLQDGTRAYVLNRGNLSLPCAAPTTAQPLGNCTVSVVNLTSNIVTATIPLITDASKVAVKNGHPNFIAATAGTPTGKVYVTSDESTEMTIIRTDTDTALTTINLQGMGVSVRVTAP